MVRAKREREAIGSRAARKPQIGEKSVARILRNDDDGQDWQRRPVRGPSSALSSGRKAQQVLKREDGGAVLSAIW